MIGPQARVPVRSLDPDVVADAQGPRSIGASAAVGAVTDVKLEVSLVRSACHRVVAGLVPGEGDASVLAGDEAERATADDRQSNDADVCRRIGKRDDPADLRSHLGKHGHGRRPPRHWNLPPEGTSEMLGRPASSRTVSESGLAARIPAAPSLALRPLPIIGFAVGHRRLPRPAACLPS
jgi:hypothetical protein